MVPFVWVVCIEAIFSVPGTITLQSVKAMGYSDKMLKAEIFKKPILILSIIIAMQYGVMAIALTLPLNTLLEFVINGVMALRPSIIRSESSYGIACRQPLCQSLWEQACCW